MLAYIKGKIHRKTGHSIIVLAQEGLGYEVNVPTTYLEKSEKDQIIELNLYTKVREDDLSLYGFKTVKELDFFKLLLQVNGIGTKSALEILGHNPDQIMTALQTNKFKLFFRLIT